MAPSVQLLLLIEIQVERDGKGKSREQRELMSQEPGKERGCKAAVQVLRERKGAGLRYPDSSDLGRESQSPFPSRKSGSRKSICHEEFALGTPIGMVNTVPCPRHHLSLTEPVLKFSSFIIFNRSGQVKFLN